MYLYLVDRIGSRRIPKLLQLRKEGCSMESGNEAAPARFAGLELCFIPYSSLASVMDEIQTPLFNSFFSRCNTCSGLFSLRRCRYLCPAYKSQIFTLLLDALIPATLKNIVGEAVQSVHKSLPHGLHRHEDHGVTELLDDHFIRIEPKFLRKPHGLTSSIFKIFAVSITVTSQFNIYHDIYYSSIGCCVCVKCALAENNKISGWLYFSLQKYSHPVVQCCVVSLAEKTVLQKHYCQDNWSCRWLSAQSLK